MSQTIFIDNDPSSPHLFNYLSTYLKSNIIRLGTAAEAIELLQLIPNIPLIIVRAESGAEKTAQLLHAWMVQAKHPGTLLVMGVDLELLGIVACMEEPINWASLLDEANQILEPEERTMQTDMRPVALQNFLYLTHAPCAVYLRLKKGFTFQYVKLFNPKAEVDVARIARFRERELSHLYVKTESVHHFIASVASELVKKLEADLPIEERILTTAHSYQLVRDLLGSPKEERAHFELSDSAIESMKDTVIASPQISKLLRFLLSNRVSKFYQHAHLRALMCHYVLSKQSWYRGDHLHVLSFTSFYIGMNLSTEKQLQIATEDELNTSGLAIHEMDELLAQPVHLLEQLKNHPGLNDYIKTIIKEAQGSPDGLGLVENPSEALHPLSKVFIVADGFVKILLNPELPSKKKDILPILGERFKNPSYQKILQSLEQKFDS